MKRAFCLATVLTLVFASASLLRAQLFKQGFVPSASMQDSSNSIVNTPLERAQTMSMTAADEPLTALQAVVQFLQLRSEQIERLGQLLRARQESATPLLRDIAEHESRLRELLESGGTPPEVGQVVIEAHLLQGQLMRVQQDFLANWGNLLDAEQRQRLESVRTAARLQPLVPAFQQLQLL